MKQTDVVIHNSTGLHARPARIFVDTAKQFRSAVRVRYKEKQVNAKSLISLLTLGVEYGQSISIEIDGEDEDVALETLFNLVESGLGEPLDGEPTTNGHPNPDTPAVAVEPSPAHTEDANAIRGVAAAPGIALGPIFQFRRAVIAVQDQTGTAAEEHTRLENALTEARKQLAALYEQTIARVGPEEAAIFAVHRDLLDDPDLQDHIHTLINNGQNAAHAWQQATQAQAATLAKLSDALLAERATDVRDVGERVLRILANASTTSDLPTEPCILIANDLTPSETAALDPTRVLGFCTAIGGPNAHTAILARALGLPAIVSAGNAVLDLPDHTYAILDGAAGTLVTSPSETAINQAKSTQQALHAKRTAAAAAAEQAATTSDGYRVEVAANVGGVDDARKAAASGAEGVGLLRTEFLFLQREQPPSEDEQFAVYRDIVTAMNGHPVIIRTLDIGGDKPLPYLNLPHEDNPFLGQRGIRLCLAYPDMLREQLRAIFRAAAFGSVRIMFPMIADIAELRATRTMIDAVRAELNAPPVEIGIMIEVPAAALMADIFAPEIDFFSIGTNDLTQYTLAMDRTNPTVAANADGLHPAVLRLINQTVQGAHAAGKWVGICGELGSDPQAVPILIGLGVDELSVSAPLVPTVKAQIRGLSLAACRDHASRVLGCATAAEVRQQGI